MPTTVDAVLTVDGYTAYRDGTSGAAATPATGTITAVPFVDLVDAETFTLDDGSNPVTVFEFDKVPDGIVGGNVLVDVSGDVSADDVATRMASSINGVGGSLLLTATPVGAVVTLVNEQSGAIGNLTTWADTVVDGGFVIVQPTGGVNGGVRVDSFKVGEGGFKVEISGNVPRTPDPFLGIPGPGQDLDVIVNPDRYPVEAAHLNPTFSKALTDTDFTDSLGPTDFPETAVDCLLLDVEYNSNGVGNPDIYEIGLFAGGKMIAYGTFDKQTKMAGVSKLFIVTLKFGG